MIHGYIRHIVVLSLVTLTLVTQASWAKNLSTPANYDGYFDLSDSETVSYVKDQLKAVGIDSNDFPAMFDAIEKSEAIYKTANGLNPQIIIPTAVLAAEGTSLEPVELVTPSYSDATSEVKVSITSSIPNSPVAVANTIGLYADGAIIGSPAGNIDVGGTGVVTSKVKEPVKSGVSTYQADGIVVFVYPASVLGESVYKELGIKADESVAVAAPINGLVSATTGDVSIDNVAPTDVNSDNEIKLCIGRAKSDCDYYYPKGTIEMPQVGSVTFPENIAADPTSGTPTDANFSASISLPDYGGGCVMSNSSIASQVRVNGNVLSWNIDPAQFGQICSGFTNGDVSNKTWTATYTFAAQVQGTSGTTWQAMISTDQDLTPGNTLLVLDPMEFMYGCLAPGTRITLAGRTKSAAIENVAAGQVVRGPDGKGLTVAGYWRGKETGRLFRIKTADGHSVDMTDQHPIPLVDGTVKLAADLEPGDVVTTDKGTSKITRIERRPYDGLVWNLDLGAPLPARAPLDIRQHAFFANGILVGDGRAQTHHGRAVKNSPARILASLPAKWHRDFYAAQIYKNAHPLP